MRDKGLDDWLPRRELGKDQPLAAAAARVMPVASMPQASTSL